MLICTIGDTHIKTDAIPNADFFINALTEYLKENVPDLIVLLGDILHTHERINTIAMNRAYTLIDNLRNIAPLYILVGNHDMINHQQFLTDQHWMNGLKEWDNVTICDVVKTYENLVFCPFVAPGRFKEALNTIDNWKDAEIIFAHQEFYGCKMGAIISEEGDKWEEDLPMVISGHIHSKQKLQDNLFYTGSSMQIAFGESEENIIAMINLNEEMEIEEVNLNLPRKKIIYTEVSKLESVKIPLESKDDIKLSIKGTYEDFKALKKTSLYKKLVKRGVKISYRHSKDIVEKSESTKNISDFNDVLKKLVEDCENNILTKFYKKIISNEN